MPFDPDAYLAKQSGFDPDAYLAKAQAKPSTTTDRILTGVMDPIHGGAQLLEEGLKRVAPDAVESVRRFNNWLADKTGLVAPIPEGGVSEMTRQRELAYQASRQAAGSTGLDVARMAGNVVSPANLALARVPMAAPTLGARVTQGIGVGAAQGALQPAIESDFWSEKGKQTALGAGVGGAMPAVAAGAARVVKPKVDAMVAKLAAEGVQMTPGQILGGWAKKAEESLTSVPIVGDIIKSAQNRGIVSFDKAVLNDALSDLGEKLPNGLTGYKATNHVKERIQDAYDQVLSRSHGEATDTFLNELANIEAMGKAGLPEKQAGELSRIIDRDILGRWTGNGAEGQRIAGETVKAIEAKLDKFAAAKFRSTDTDDYALAGAIKETQAALRRMIDEVNPDNAAAWKAANSAWAKFKRIERAASSTAAMTNEGVFTPTQYSMAVKAADRTKNKAATATGNALGQDLAVAGKNVLAQSVNDSGTPGRLMTAGAIWNLLKNPTAMAGSAAMLIPAAGVGALYNRPANWLFQQALTARPESANLLADLVRGSGNYLAPAGIAALENR